jgi:OOP family OmpA-OmpF porin
VTLAIAGTAWAETAASGVTDFSASNPSAIDADDIAEALAVPRGTRIEASAPPTVRLPIFFEFDSAELRPEASQLLGKVGAALTAPELEPFNFSIEGHTDSVGSEDYNRELSARRAAAVRSFLMAQGVPESRMATVGHGEADPVAPNESDEGRRRNRRVELINRGAVAP